MLPNIKLIGIPIIAITSYKESTLAKYADYLIELPVMREATSLNLAPTSSTTAALVVGDAILLPSKIVLDKPLESHRPISATKDFWDEWDSNEPDNVAINEAIEALRKQCRI